MSTPAEPILDVRGLRVAFDTDDGRFTAVDGISFQVHAGKTLGLVGESGCGKSVTAFSLMKLLPQPAGIITDGTIHCQGTEIVSAGTGEMAKIRGACMGMIFQEPMTALNPVQRIGRQVSEVFLLHKTKSKEEARASALSMLRQVGIPAPEVRYDEYPHQLSGGMRQRVMIAMALACRPALLIADEPTTALDVTVQAQILDLMGGLQRELGMATVLITHDLGVIAGMCDDVAVMYAGRIVEKAPAGELFARPRHAYTRGLMAAIPRLTDTPGTLLTTIPGQVPALRDMPAGCRFCLRNGAPADSPTLRERPPFSEISPGHWVENCPRCVMPTGKRRD
ncbi:MAG: peptide transporter ATP-binding protein [Verrucomicrobiales bacterium]|nr:peptide transporter ATP-binding protein [Verrucomicrobiales bacterium]